MRLLICTKASFSFVVRLLICTKASSSWLASLLCKWQQYCSRDAGYLLFMIHAIWSTCPIKLATIDRQQLKSLANSSAWLHDLDRPGNDFTILTVDVDVIWIWMSTPSGWHHCLRAAIMWLYRHVYKFLEIFNLIHVLGMFYCDRNVTSKCLNINSCTIVKSYVVYILACSVNDCHRRRNGR